jgi:hypothetical protein
MPKKIPPIKDRKARGERGQVSPLPPTPYPGRPMNKGKYFSNFLNPKLKGLRASEERID